MPRAVGMSAAAMGSLKKLPLEISKRIIRELCGFKINHFDSVGVKDLQNVRLVSTVV